MNTKVIWAILILFIIPELLGLLVLRFWKKQRNNLVLAFVLGYILEFAIGQLISVPLIFKDGSFTLLVKIYFEVICVLSIISFLLNIFRIKEILIDMFKNLKGTPILLSLVVLVLIGMQLFIYAFYGHVDGDDATYVAYAVSAVHTDTLYKYSGPTGTDRPMEQVVMRYRLGPFPLFYAIESKLIDVHPAIIAHTVLPVILLSISYMIYWLFAKLLFEKDKKSALIFMIFICILHYFSYYNGTSTMIMALTRIWQGKAVLASIILPLLLLLYLYKEKYNSKFWGYLAILITVLAGCFTTTMATAMAPITVMLTAFVYECVKLASKETKFWKSCIVLFISLICCTPSIIYGLIYVMDYIK